MNLKAQGKEYIRRLVVSSRVFDLAGRFAAPVAAILMYHSVRDDPRHLADFIGPGITHATSIFKRQMEIVAREFKPVTLDEILLFLRGDTGLPRRAIAVTFDDGFGDNEEVAAPILNRFGIRAAFYATAGLIGTTKAPWYSRLRYAFLTTRKKEWTDTSSGRTWDLRDSATRDAALLSVFDACAPMVADVQERAVRGIEAALETQATTSGQNLMMSWDQLRKLYTSGHIVGSHTLTHPNVAHVSYEGDLWRELLGSKQRIQGELGSTVLHFSYPHPALEPQWSEKTMTMTASAGYKSAVTTTPGRVTADANPLCLKRVNPPRPEEHFRWNLGRTFLGQRAS
jgi:peptidoglycan/xylan/chitin deacetylase (PgdA/CDA1 family)